jgi:hypothetical protein
MDFFKAYFSPAGNRGSKRCAVIRQVQGAPDIPNEVPERDHESYYRILLPGIRIE